MRLEDSKSKTKIDVNAYKAKKISIYLCGPTVYDEAHLGHARSSVCFDLLYRTLLALHFEVEFARNYTDIDDKILAKMNTHNTSLKELTQRYIQAYEEDMRALNVLEPQFKPKATEFISAMIEFIQKLENQGFTYVLEDGVYFDTAKDKDYLSLSRRDFENNQSRLEKEVHKKNSSDFVLWKFDSNFYDAPFGKGRPGWHTECVAMIKSLFKDGLIIHCGGVDLLFPHHENEAAQYRCAYQNELAQIWLHNGFVKINDEKMSKSLNNSFFVKDALCKFGGEVLRFYLLQTHYRVHFNYSDQDLEGAKKRLDKLYRLKKRLNIGDIDDFCTEKHDKANFDSDYTKEILEALQDDLNISKALAVFDEFITNANLSLDKAKKNDDLKPLTSAFKQIAMIFGVGFIKTSQYFQFGVSDTLKKEIEEQILARNEAKKAKNFALADAIRANLADKNIILQDTPNGTIWERNND